MGSLVVLVLCLTLDEWGLISFCKLACYGHFLIKFLLVNMYKQFCLFPNPMGRLCKKPYFMPVLVVIHSFVLFCEMKRKGVLQCHVYKWPLRTIKNKAFTPNDNLAE